MRVIRNTAGAGSAEQAAPAPAFLRLGVKNACYFLEFVAEYQDMIQKTWTNAYENGVFDRAHELIKKSKADLKDAFDRNYQRWDNINHESFAHELPEKAEACKTYEDACDFLLEWLHSRVEYLNNYWHL